MQLLSSSEVLVFSCHIQLKLLPSKSEAESVLVRQLSGTLERDDDSDIASEDSKEPHTVKTHDLYDPCMWIPVFRCTVLLPQGPE